jgi:hypothetical protein
MTRTVYNFQVGFKLFPITEDEGDAWPPSWAGDDILAWLRLRVWGTGDSSPELLLRGSGWETLPSAQGRMRTDQIQFTDGDPDTSDLLAYLDLGYSNLHASPFLLGSTFQLMSGAYAEDDYYPYFVCSAGIYYSAIDYRSPSVRVQDAAFVIHDWPGEAASVPSGSCSLYWDDVNKVLKAMDHSETVYTIGP